MSDDIRGDSPEDESACAAGDLPPDIDRADADDWPARKFPVSDGRRENSVRVVIKQSVLNDIHRHGQLTTDVEICGVLVGAGYRDDRGPFVFVEANIRGRHSDSKAAQVTFTSETWNHIHNELDQNYPDLQILGWYHTHPGFGIFLSGMDLFIHENYFSGKHQLAFVYDPIGGDEGLFVWRNGKALRDGFLIMPDEDENPPPVATAPPTEPATAGATNGAASRGVDADDELARRLTRIENRQSLAELGAMTAMVLALAVPLLMWFLWIRPQLPVLPHGPSRRPSAPSDVAPRNEPAKKDLPATQAPDSAHLDTAPGDDAPIPTEAAKPESAAGDISAEDAPSESESRTPTENPPSD